MKLRTYKKIKPFSNILELILLGFSVYYTGKFGKDIQAWVLIGVYIALIALSLLDFFNGKLRTNNLDLLIKYFYEQNYFSPNADVRVTIHKKINAREYVQYVDYFRDGAKRGKRHL